MKISGIMKLPRAYARGFLRRGIKHTFPYLIIAALSFMVLKPSFSLALFGDDWLAFQRYEIHLGKWSSGRFNHLSYFLTPYGAQDILMGIMNKLFGYEYAKPYYIFSFILRMIASGSVFWFTKKITNKTEQAFFAALFFAVTPVGIESTNWVFNMPTYLAIFFLTIFFYFFIQSHREKSFTKIVPALFFFYLAYVTAPIRMHGLIPLIIIFELAYTLINKRRAIIKKVVLRIILICLIFILIRNTGESLGVASDMAQRIKNGSSYMINSLKDGQYAFLLNPTITIGRFLYSESLWPILNQVVSKVKFSSVFYFSLISYSPFILFYHQITYSKKYRYNSLLFLGVPMIIWTIIVRSILLKNPINFPDYHLVGQALVGGYLILYGIVLSIIKKKEPASITTLLSVLWIPFSFLVAWFAVPDSTYPAVHRYSVMGAVGVSIFFGSLMSFAKNKPSKTLIYTIIVVLVIIHAKVSNNYLKALIPLRGTEITRKVWGSFPHNNLIGNSEEPIIYYFEGNRAILYYTITFGFPPHISLLYDIKDGNKLPVPMDIWEDLVTAVTTGENMAAYGFKKEPVPINKVYAFRLNDSKMTDVSSEVRKLLKEYEK